METTKILFNAVVNEINNGFNNIENATKIFKRQFNWKLNDIPESPHTLHPIKSKYGIKCIFVFNYIGGFSCCFGDYTFKTKDLGINLFRKEYFRSCGINSLMPTYSNGIEVFGRTLKQVKSGSWIPDIHTGVQLKSFCKMNGIKGYSKMDNRELVIALLKC
jgi:hypothetical protein